jgi:hypothetical protein
MDLTDSTWKDWSFLTPLKQPQSDITSLLYMGQQEVFKYHLWQILKLNKLYKNKRGKEVLENNRIRNNLWIMFVFSSK